MTKTGRREKAKKAIYRGAESRADTGNRTECERERVEANEKKRQQEQGEGGPGTEGSHPEGQRG